MSRRNLAGLALLALVALATGFVLAGQVRTQLLTPTHQVARYISEKPFVYGAAS
jgi:hypothetical protein